MSNIFKEWGEALEEGFGETAKIEKEGSYPVKLKDAFYSDKFSEQIGISFDIQKDGKTVNSVVWYKLDKEKRMKTLYEDVLIPTKWKGLEATEGSPIEIIKSNVDSIAAAVKGKEATLIVEAYDYKGKNYLEKTLILKEKNKEEVPAFLKD